MKPISKILFFCFYFATLSTFAGAPLNPMDQSTLKEVNAAVQNLKSLADQIFYQQQRFWSAVERNNCRFDFQSLYRFVAEMNAKTAVFANTAKPPWRARSLERARDERLQSRGKQLVALGEKIVSDLSELRQQAQTMQSKWCIPDPTSQEPN
jgi:hypothetical protein